MIIVYKDTLANAIYFQDANGVQFLNSLQALIADPLDLNPNLVSVKDLAKDIFLVSDIPFSDFIDDNGEQHGLTVIDTVNKLNTIFAAAGTESINIPVIKSSLAVTMTQGDILNYELLADYGVGYEWDLSNVPGIQTVEGNPRRLIGGNLLTPAVYNIPIKAINYNGTDSKVVVLTVQNTLYSNTRSIEFYKNDWMDTDPAPFQTILGRVNNGTGASDAWSIHAWFKPGSSSAKSQTIFFYGKEDVVDGSHIEIQYNGKSGEKRLAFDYGSETNHLEFETPVNSIISGTWHHILVTYDGGTTGNNPANIADYYSRFKIHINGVNQTLLETNTNYGESEGLIGEAFRIGRYNKTDYMESGCRVDEMAVWNSDQSSNIALIYNAGTTQDLSLLGVPPSSWWRFGDEDSYPTIYDNIGTSDFNMYNMTQANIVTDAP